MNGSQVYWDSCIFIALCTNEVRDDPMDLQGIHDLVKEIDAGKIHVVTSVLTRIEVLQCTLPPDGQTLFGSLFQRRNCHLVGVSSKIIDIAHEIRDYYQQRKDQDNLPTGCCPDLS